MEKIWISGANGHVGSALVKMLDFEKYKFIATDKNEVDITDIESVHSFCKLNRPDIIINCSGLTDLQECEENPDLAYAVNAVGVRNIAQEAQEIGAKLIQISTDDVFGTTENKVLLNEFDDIYVVVLYQNKCNHHFRRLKVLIHQNHLQQKSDIHSISLRIVPWKRNRKVLERPQALIYHVAAQMLMKSQFQENMKNILVIHCG